MSTSHLNRAALLRQLDAEGRSLGARSTLFNHAVADHLGINVSDLECLDLIILGGPLTAGALAEMTGLTTGAITGVIDRLERDGFARRGRDPEDRRRVIVSSIPEATSGRIEPLFKALVEKLNEVYAEFDDEELEVIRRYAQGVNEVFRKETLRLREAEVGGHGTS